MLEVHMQTTIKTLFKQGYNKSQIARLLYVDRKTVRNVIWSKESGHEQVPRKEYPSQFSPYEDYILAKMEKVCAVR